jgi:hypothetical protein
MVRQDTKDRLGARIGYNDAQFARILRFSADVFLAGS